MDTLSFTTKMVVASKIRACRIRRYSLFFCLLFVVLSLCVPGKGSCAVGYDPADDQARKEETDLSPVDRIAALNKIEDWKKFKAFWNKLDEIKPAKTLAQRKGIYSTEEAFNYLKKSFPGGSWAYKMLISGEEADSLKQELRWLISGLKRVAWQEFTPAEISLLERLCFLRIEGFLSEIYYTQSPISYIDREKEILLSDVEQKIDKFKSIKKRWIINEQEYQQALFDMNESIKLYYALYTVSQLYFPYFNELFSSGRYSLDLIENYIARVEKEYAEYSVKKKKEIKTSALEDSRYKDMNRKLPRVKKDLEDIKKMFPAFYEITTALEM